MNCCLVGTVNLSLHHKKWNCLNSKWWEYSFSPSEKPSILFVGCSQWRKNRALQHGLFLLQCPNTLPIILMLSLDAVHITTEVTRLHIEDTTPGYLTVGSIGAKGWILSVRLWRTNIRHKQNKWLPGAVCWCRCCKFIVWQRGCLGSFTLVIAAYDCLMPPEQLLRHSPSRTSPAVEPGQGLCY